MHYKPRSELLRLRFRTPGINWSANSPDLNPVENIWTILKNRKNRAAPRNAEELKKVVDDAADSDEIQAMAKKLAGSFRLRLETCLKAKGEFTRW